MESIDKALGELADTQYGVFARRQALLLGLTDDALFRRVERGVLVPAEVGVLRLHGAPVTWRQRLMATCLAGGDGAAVSHQAAAALWRFDGFKPGPVEVTVRRPRHPFHHSPVVHRSRDLLPIDVTHLGPLPVTTPARTLVDLAGAVHPLRVKDAMDSAFREGKTSPAFVKWRLEQLRKRGRRGVRVLDSLLSAEETVVLPGSVLERRFLRIISKHRLPPPVRQHHVRTPNAHVLARVDFAYPELHLVIEVEGHAYHATREQRSRDTRRQNEVELQGWRVLRFTFEQVTFEPDWVGSQVRRALPLLGAESRG